MVGLLAGRLMSARKVILSGQQQAEARVLANLIADVLRARHARAVRQGSVGIQRSEARAA